VAEGVPPVGRRRTLATIAAASAALAVATVPMFLFGALSGSIGAELGFGTAQAGAVVTTFFLAAAVTAVPLGRVTESLGGRRAMRLGVVTSAVGCALVGTVAADWWHLAVLLGIVGGVLPFVDTGAARTFTTAVTARRRGAAFGIKEASVPFASMLAGLAVPAVAGTAGWRAAFLAAAAVGPLAWAALAVVPPAAAAAPHGGGRQIGPRPARTGSRPGRAALPRAVPVLAVGFALAGGAAAAAVAFLVPAAVAVGMTPAAAGTALAVASAGSIVARLVAGLAADRHPHAVGALLVVGMALGALGALVLALGRPGWPIVVASALTLTAGWGWTGLGFTALVRLAPETPAAAAGVGLTGLAVGGTVGPLLFGVVVGAAGAYAWGWTTLAAAFGLGAAAVAVALAGTRPGGRSPASRSTPPAAADPRGAATDARGAATDPRRAATDPRGPAGDP
jgi:MFS family permease